MKNCRFLALLGMTSLVVASTASAQKAEPNTVVGVVRGADKQPMPGVEVALRPSGKRAQTDSLGQYRVANVSPGSYVAVARKPGFRTEHWDVAVQRNAGAMADFTLAVRDADPVVPDSNRKCEGLSLRGFDCRRSVANGMFFDFPDIDTRRETVPELFRDIPGFRVRLRPGSVGGGYMVEPSSGATCIYYIVDGKAVTQANPVPPTTRDIYAMEIYRKADSVPVTDMRELQRANNVGTWGNCRVVLFWTTWAKS
jgi:hypothetical protein